MIADPTSAEAFEERYRAAADPWDFGGSAYEQGRYDAILAALGRRHYHRAYEPACSVGELTVLLAARCSRLRAVDVSATAVARAIQRCGHLPHVDLAVASVADDPLEAHDLVVFSEVGYYFEINALDRVIERLAASVVPGGELVGCHWLGDSADHRLHGSTVHDRLHRAFRGDHGFQHRVHLDHGHLDHGHLDHVHLDHGHLDEETPGFVLDAWRRR
jgi:hypothetical protein